MRRPITIGNNFDVRISSFDQIIKLEVVSCSNRILACQQNDSTDFQPSGRMTVVNATNIDNQSSN